MIGVRVRPGRRAGAAAVVLLATTACSDGGDGNGSASPDPTPGLTPTGTASVAPAEPTGSSTPDARPSAPPLTTGFEQAASARELARRLTVAEDLLRADGTAEEVLDAAAFETQLLYRQLTRTRGWQRQVRAAVPHRYRALVDDHVTARRELRSLHASLSDRLPAWEIIDPEPTPMLRGHYREGERTYGVPWEVLAAINLIETGFGRIDGLSTAGAQGPMQFIPGTWEAYGEGDIDDPHDAILSAARYLAANGGDGDRADLEQALFRYNNHRGYVAGVLAYAAILQREPRALADLVRWQIIYLSERGDVWLPVGYHREDPIPVRRYLRQHPDRHLGTRTD